MVNSYLYFARRHYFLKRLVLFHMPGKIMHWPENFPYDYFVCDT